MSTLKYFENQAGGSQGIKFIRPKVHSHRIHSSKICNSRFFSECNQKLGFRFCADGLKSMDESFSQGRGNEAQRPFPQGNALVFGQNEHGITPVTGRTSSHWNINGHSVYKIVPMYPANDGRVLKETKHCSIHLKTLKQLNNVYPGFWHLPWLVKCSYAPWRFALYTKCIPRILAPSLACKVQLCALETIYKM